MLLTFTDHAIAKIEELQKLEEEQEIALRVAVQGKSKNGFQYAIGFVLADDREEEDFVLDIGPMSVLVDKDSQPVLTGSTVDFVTEGEQSGFKIDNPNPLYSSPLAETVEEVLTSKINPAVADHGGFVELVDVKDDIAYIRFGGGCQGCGMANVTLRNGVEVMIKHEVPEIARVVDMTEHDKGANPYYPSQT
jgi:Fe/S biogenesis protein NfuA